MNSPESSKRKIIKPLPPRQLPQTPQLPQLPQTMAAKSKTIKTIKLKKLPLSLDDTFYILIRPFYFNSIIYEDKRFDSIMEYILLDEYVKGEYRDNIKKLKEHIQENSGGRFNEYHKYIDIMHNIINDYNIYELINKNKTEEFDNYFNNFKKLLSTYDPLDYEKEDDFKNLRMNILTHIFIEFYDAIIIYEFKKAIIHDTDDKVTKNTFKKKIIAKMPFYNMMLKIALFINDHYFQSTGRIFIQNIKLINMLINYDNFLIKNTYEEPLDFESPASLSSGDSSLKVVINGKTKKENLLNFLLDNTGYTNKITENHTDPISFEEWGKMSYSELKKIIKISYRDVEKQANYYYLYDASFLYKFWRKIKDDNLINPITRIPMTEEEKLKILITLNKRDFRKDIRSGKKDVEKTRYDVELYLKRIMKDGKEYDYIYLYYITWRGIIDNKYNINKTINIAEIYVDIKFNKRLKELYLRKIINLYKNNKIVSEKLPLKIHPAFTKYNLKIIENEDDYNDFESMFSIQ